MQSSYFSRFDISEKASLVTPIDNESVKSKPLATEQTTLPLKASQKTSPHAPTPNPYFLLNSYERILAVASIVIIMFVLCRFGLKTLAMNETTPIAGVHKSIFGYYQDQSDEQWTAYSENFFIILIESIVFLVVSKLMKSTSSNFTPRLVFSVLLGGGVFAFMFRGGLLFWLFFTSLNYLQITLFFKYDFFPILIWGSNIALIVLNDRYHGFNLVNFFHSNLLQPIQDTTSEAIVSWHVVYNMTLLRIISFGMDKFWAHKKFRHISEEKHRAQCIECTDQQVCLKELQEQNLQPQDYNILSFFGYILYVPVLLTGPPVTFNAFLNQMRASSLQKRLIPIQDKIKYSLRTILVFITFTVWTHINFGYALTTVSSNEHLWQPFPPSELYFCGFNALLFIWMKFNCLWKFSRCIALWDDIEVPENMNRCMMNNYNFEQFWRSWHRGFNQWLIRYVYLPCGGSRTKKWNVWVVFTFVAIWHDLNINLILWAWGICLCLIPEISVKKMVNSPSFNKYTQNHKWKYVCAVAAGIYIVWLVFTNLIGFGKGYEIIGVMMKKAFSSLGGITEFILTILALAGLSLTQMEMREFETSNF